MQSIIDAIARMDESLAMANRHLMPHADRWLLELRDGYARLIVEAKRALAADDYLTAASLVGLPMPAAAGLDAQPHGEPKKRQRSTSKKSEANDQPLT